ncbi:MAG: aminoacyl-histidine dipeptidase [Prevotellaceae bacterium]|nr:aminoacyl-histidine dipeptidase [Prevotellaceae bacterium]
MKNLEPKRMWNYFYEITQIPRPSKNEGKIVEYLKAFAEKNGLEIKTDNVQNVIISKPATAGYENHKRVVLQAHVDMVAEKNADVEFNFDTDPIQAYIDGDWIKAKGTTLGADNGIGVAMALAVLTDENLKHPALECLFTVDEETGLTGAFALDEKSLSGDILINLDSEDDGEIFVGCAGGIDTLGKITYTPEKTPQNYFGCSITVRGLKGGHSGDDIDKGLGNANKILNRFLWMTNARTDLRLSSFNGGNLHNAIPREATAVVCVPDDYKEKLRAEINLFASILENEFGDREPNLKIELESVALPETVIDKATSDRLLMGLYVCPHGIKAMSFDMPGLVETSTNLASVKMKGSNTIEINTSQRSSIESAKYDIAYQVESALKLAGAAVTHGDGYPGWQPNLKSEILRIASDSYKKRYKEDPKIRAIHAGLECGLFLKKYPHLDMISIGPTMRGVHSPDEKLNIPSTQKTWDWLVDILASIE